MPYDLHIRGLPAWGELVDRGLDVVVDPMLFRIGEYFLGGKRAADPVGDRRWQAVESDLGTLVAFFDLVVMHDQLPAFNYFDTFGYEPNQTPGSGLSDLLNVDGDRMLFHVNVEYEMYRQVKHAAMGELRRLTENGPFVSRATAERMLATLDATEYGWEPSLEGIGNRLSGADELRIARFVLGQLVFAGYAQQTGSPHVLAPSRTLALASFGLRLADPTAATEATVYDELRRRCRDAGDGWRDDDLPWTPSFLPYLVKKTRQYREGPDKLLERAKELRNSPAVERYRELRAAMVAEDAHRSREARRELESAADAVARSLDSTRPELEVSGRMMVEVLPKAVGVAAGANAGALAAGPLGATVGGLVGLVGEELLRPVQRRLWGWVLDELPFRSARKLLTRMVRAEHELVTELGPRLRAIWETGRADDLR